MCDSVCLLYLLTYSRFTVQNCTVSVYCASSNLHVNLLTTLLYVIVNLSPQASPSRHAALRGGARSPSRTPPAAPRTARAVSPRRASPSPRSTGCRRPGVVYGRCWYGDPMIAAPRPSRCEWPGHSNAAHGSSKPLQLVWVWAG